MSFEPWIGAGVIVATAATDAVYVKFTSAVVGKRALAAANWSGIWYMLSSFAVIGSWIGAFVTLKYFNREPSHPPAPLKPSA